MFSIRLGKKKATHTASTDVGLIHPYLTLQTFFSPHLLYHTSVMATFLLDLDQFAIMPKISFLFIFLGEKKRPSLVRV